MPVSVDTKRSLSLSSVSYSITLTDVGYIFHISLVLSGCDDFVPFAFSGDLSIIRYRTW